MMEPCTASGDALNSPFSFPESGAVFCFSWLLTVHLKAIIMHLVGQHLPYCRGERTQITMSSLPDLHDVDITNYVSMLYLETKVSRDWGTAQPQFLKQYHDDVHLSPKCRIAPISSKIIYRGYNQARLEEHGFRMTRKLWDSAPRKTHLLATRSIPRTWNRAGQRVGAQYIVLSPLHSRHALLVTWMKLVPVCDGATQGTRGLLGPSWRLAFISTIYRMENWAQLRGSQPRR
ncbi:uncharacterized protein AAG666_012411 isoform 2-T2 [Megaptera novaeangliae]